MGRRMLICDALLGTGFVEKPTRGRGKPPTSVAVGFLCTPPAALEIGKPARILGPTATEPSFFLLLSDSLEDYCTHHSSISSDCYAACNTLTPPPRPLKHCDNVELDGATCTALPAPASLQQTESFGTMENIGVPHFREVFLKIFLCKDP